MKHLIRIIKGAFIGIAMLVPGVSGGTMAIILGVYQEMIDSVADFFKDIKGNLPFLLELALGGVTGILLLSNLLASLLQNYEMEMQFLFIGIICGGLPTLFNKVKSETKHHLSDYLAFAIGLALVFVMLLKPDGLITIATQESLFNWFLLFIAGIVIAIALVLPGISASFMLLILGVYSFTLTAINDRNLFYLLPLVLGIGFGTLATSKIIQICLKRYRTQTYMLILGFVIGSVCTLFPGVPSGLQWLTCIGLSISGFIALYLLGRVNLID